MFTATIFFGALYMLIGLGDSDWLDMIEGISLR